MDIEIVTIGTELLLGFTVDTNGAELGRALAECGVQVVRRTAVPDTPAAIRAAVSEALGRTRAVLTTGGLGPTRDDMSKAVVAELYGWPLVFEQGLWDDLVARFQRVGRTPVARNRSQAEVPAGATVLPNRWGTAPGLWFDGPPGLTIMLPGVPTEMRGLLAHEVVPRLRALAAGRVTRSRTLRTTGIAESALAERLGGLEERLAPLTLAYLPGVDGVDLRVTAWGMADAEATLSLDGAMEVVRRLVGDLAYTEGDRSLAEEVLGLLRERGLSLAVAESCTGGMLGARLTAVPGASEVFVGGVIAYADTVKVGLLEVPHAELEAHGAVSEPVVRAMAAGARTQTGADAAIAITGIAGPGGGSEAKPVGTVWVAVDALGTSEAVRMVLVGNREEVRARAAQAALDRLRRFLLA